MPTRPAAAGATARSRQLRQRPAQARPDAANKPADKGTFVLTSFSASAEPVPGDQVNLNRLLDVARVTADSWRPDYRPEDVLDTRNENGWSPDTGARRPGAHHRHVRQADRHDATRRT